MFNVKIISGWSDKNLKCDVCGTDKSVKYGVHSTNNHDEKYTVCNLCVSAVYVQNIKEVKEK